MRRAAKDRGWENWSASSRPEKLLWFRHTTPTAVVYSIEMEGIRGFLPVSQLAAGHYPRVSGADKDEILQKLNALTNKDLRVRIPDVSRKDNKLIFSEKRPLRKTWRHALPP